MSQSLSSAISASSHGSTILAIEKPIVAGNDDVEQRMSGGMWMDSTDLELSTDKINVQTVGLRFTDLAIPAGAVVTRAYIQFQVDETDSVETDLQVRGLAADDLAPFTSERFDLTSRETTSAIANWVPDPWGVVHAAGEGQRTPDLTAIVQEIVSRAGWEAGNDLGFSISGSGSRTAEAFDGNPLRAPVLHIEYSIGQPPPAPVDVRFAAFGDYGNRGGAAAVAQLVDSMNVDFIVTTGDNVYGSESIDQQIGSKYSDYIGDYDGAFGAGSVTNRFFPSIGNHEYNGEGGGVPAYLDYFTLPGNERYYEFVEGPVHFFALNSNPEEPDGRSSTGTQADWLKAALAASDSPFKIVYFHHPPYSSGDKHGSTETLRWPFEEWGATAVLSGHDHVYERLLRDDNDDGTFMPYFVTGLGGASPYGFDTPLDSSKVRYSDDFGAMLIQASEESITFEFWAVGDGGAGKLIDSFMIDHLVSATRTTADAAISAADQIFQPPVDQFATMMSAGPDYLL